jgi:hypothetical protein
MLGREPIMTAGTFEMSFARASMCLEAGRGLSLKDARVSS